MNTLVVPDLHGNADLLLSTLQRVGAIVVPGYNKNDDNSKIERVPDWHIIQVGDLVNMCPQHDIYRGFQSQDKIMLEFVYNDGNYLIDEILVGNHEVYYTHNLDVGRFSGMATSIAQLEPNLIDFLVKFIHDGHFKTATTVHANNENWLITHAGLHSSLVNLDSHLTRNAQDVATFLNY